VDCTACFHPATICGAGIRRRASVLALEQGIPWLIAAPGCCATIAAAMRGVGREGSFASRMALIG
jgi:hypothetical protein